MLSISDNWAVTVEVVERSDLGDKFIKSGIGLGVGDFDLDFRPWFTVDIGGAIFSSISSKDPVDSNRF